MRTIEAEHPAQIGVSAEIHWIVSADDVRRLTAVNRDSAKTPRDEFTATVILGNGTRKHFVALTTAIEVAIQ